MLHACSANVSTFPQAQLGSLRNSQTKVNKSVLQTTRHPVQFVTCPMLLNLSCVRVRLSKVKWQFVRCLICHRICRPSMLSDLPRISNKGLKAE